MAAEKKDPTPIELTVRNHVEVTPVSGAFGGFGANDMFRVNFHYDDMKLGIQIQDGKEVIEPLGITREIQARLVMNPQTAISISIWMMKALAERGLIKPEDIANHLAGKDVN
ncbi:MAG: hypothetical protein OEW12_02275 [Deltaproteobacteria bacterium]|nr:hypothetical protein [Deltaproteobacteria bacterium]